MTSSEAWARESAGVADVLRFFQGLAKAVGAIGAIPSKDGCVLFAFARGGRTWRVFWSPIDRPGGIRVRGLPGCLVAQGQASFQDLEALGNSLVAIRTRSDDERKNPLFVPPRRNAPVQLSPDLFAQHLPRLLEPGNTRWGAFLFESVRQGQHWIDLRFVAPDSEVILAIRPRSLLGQPPQGGSCFRLDVAYDTRPNSVAKSLHGAVENYVSYALSRTFPPSQAFEIPTQEGGFEVHDLYDETPSDRFFLGTEHRRISCQHTFSTLLEADEGVGFVLHVTAECASHYAWIKSSAPHGHLHARPAVLPMAFPAKRTEFVEVGEMDAVTGAEQRLRESIRRTVSDPDTRVVVTCGTCISHLLNMPIETILEEEAADEGLPTSFLEFVVDDTARPEQVWVDLLQVVDREAIPKPGHINLVGYAAADSDLVREAEPLLQAGGIHVVGWLVPSFRTTAARRFLEAASTFVSTASLAAGEFADARKAWPQMPFVDLAPPFGLAATRSFYHRIIELGAGHSTAAVDDAYERLLPEWERWRARANRHSVGFLVHPDEAAYLTNPPMTHGANLIELLAEMGFRLVVHCANGPEPGDGARTRAALRQHFSGLVERGGLDVQLARAPGNEAIQHLTTSLIFSEYPADARVLATGCMPFGTADIEPGYAGALRALVKLVRLAENRFHSVYACAGKPRTPCD